MNTRGLISGLIIGLCLLMRGVLERDPVTHILIQLPALVFSGFILVQPDRIRDQFWNQGGWSPLLVALFMSIFWMLPRSIDAALIHIEMELVKFVSIPLLIGIPLAIGWSRAHPVLVSFIKAQTISMLLLLSFLYTHAPMRICNSYLVNDQVRLGYGFLVLAIIVGIVWVIPLFSLRISPSGSILNSVRLS